MTTSRRTKANCPDTSSPVEGIFFSFVEANGILHRLASTEPVLLHHGMPHQKRYPLVLFLHGFPESWYSWRFQLLFLKDLPFLPVAPDMRGYGSTSQPAATEDYTQPVIAKDVVEIAKALGYERFIVVGHDWGCQAAWSVALLFPYHILGVFGLSVPYAGTPKTDMLTLLQLKYGPCLDESVPRTKRKSSHFHYMLHHCLPKSTEEYDKNGREFLYRIYTNRPGCEAEDGTPEYDIRGKMFASIDEKNYAAAFDATSAPGLWKRLPRPKTLPRWLLRKDLDYITNEFERAGFHGGLSWYRAMELNHSMMKKALRNRDGRVSDKILQPSLFVIGENDDLIDLYGGKDQIIRRLHENLSRMTRDPIFINDTGHWVQIEARDAVNEALLKFLKDVEVIHQERTSRL